MARNTAGRNHHGMGSSDQEPDLLNVAKTRNESTVASLVGKVLGVCGCRSNGGWAQRINSVFVA